MWDMCSRLPCQPTDVGRTNLALSSWFLFKLGHKVTGRGWAGAQAQMELQSEQVTLREVNSGLISGSHVLLAS